MDEAKLTAYLEQHIDGFHGPLTLKKFPGGQSNPTYLITAASGKYVLRSKPPGKLLKSAHAVDREYQVTKALGGTDVPVATPLHLCQDEDVIGSWFYVMNYIDGRIFWDPALPNFTPAERGALYLEMNRVLAAIHSVDLKSHGLQDYGKPGNYFARQIGRWTSQYKASETETIDEMEQLMAWVADHIPPDDSQVSLIHGDYRIDNLIFHPTRPEIIAVVDWELSTLGHPLADLAYQCMQWRMPSVSLMRGLDGLDRAALGIPTEEDYIRAYAERRGLTGITHWPFYLAFSFFRLAAIVQGVMKRSLDGNASNDRAQEVGRLARPLATKALAILKEHNAL
ncbi:phosphotransferase [Paremcibacter congregatus]|uniref:phosphotransferase n=1 Tax=Paremcibacter congregatus TaxID=2043170 RepID=UPI0030EF7146|tara:strand:+ start:4438 stop:5454 length:1017 start_codon:yes stop_codon:yes gene_type:complete